jgi:hypothetical protein
MRPNAQSRGVAVYLLFTLALSSVFYFLIARSGRVGGGWGAYIGCLMWCPGVAALLTCKYLGRDMSTRGVCGLSFFMVLYIIIYHSESQDQAAGAGTLPVCADHRKNRGAVYNKTG